MAEITLFEGDDSKADFTLTYSQLWSDTTKRGLPVAQADVSVLYFYVKRLLSDTTAWLALTSASASQIKWINGPGATDGRVRVIFGTGTSGHAGDNQRFELRIKFTDGTFATAEAGTFNVI